MHWIVMVHISFVFTVDPLTSWIDRKQNAENNCWKVQVNKWGERVSEIETEMRAIAINAQKNCNEIIIINLMTSI